MKWIALTLLFMFAGGTAVYAQPSPKSTRYAAAGMAVWGIRQDYAADDTLEEITLAGTVNGNTFTPACFRWNSLVRIRAAGGEFTCAWSMTSTLTFDGNSDSENGCQLTDANGRDGSGACFAVADEERVDQVPQYHYAARAIGARSGICSGPVNGQMSGPYTPSCRVDGDCTEAGVSGGTCDTSLSAAQKTTLAQKSCAFLLCHTDTDGADLVISIER